MKTMSNIMDKKEIFKSFIDGLSYKYEDNPYMLINYDIYDDLKDVSDKDKIKFFSYITNIEKIKKDYNNKFTQLYYILKYIFSNQDSTTNLNSIMYKTQKHINKQGKKLLHKITRLYDLFL